MYELNSGSLIYSLVRNQFTIHIKFTINKHVKGIIYSQIKVSFTIYHNRYI